MKRRRIAASFSSSSSLFVIMMMLAVITVLGPLSLNTMGGCSLAQAQDMEDDDIMNELLEEQRRLQEEEDRMYDDDDDDPMNTMRQQQQQQEEESARQQQEQKNEQIRQAREAAFERELASYNDNQDKIKAAKKQKRVDAAIVKRVLKAFRMQKYYAVLGLYNLEISIGPFRIWKTRRKIGPFTFFRPTSKHIRKAFRSRAVKVHPDKNRDGRANEAFLAVEEAHSILSDATKRELYNVQQKVARLEQRDAIVTVVVKVYSTAQFHMMRIVGIVRKLLGPFATPIFIIGSLIV